jgi:YD repeat-containing protein
MPVGTGTIALNSIQRYSGARSVEISHPTATSYACIAQNTPVLTANKTYTASAYFKAVGVGGAGAAVEAVICSSVTHGVVSSVLSERLTGTTDPNVNGGWQRLTCTFSVPAGCYVDRVAVGLYNSSGTIYVSCLQVEEGAVPNQANLFVDSGFERGYGNSSTAHTGSYSRSLTGNYAHNAAGHPLGLSGSAGDVYVFGGWAKADSVPGGSFRLAVGVTLTDGTTRYTFATFNPNISGWQFAMAAVDTRDPAKPAMGYIDITLNLDFHAQANTAWFDDVFIYRDNAVAYTYDSSGNLTTAKDAAASASAFDYNGGNIAKVASPTGTCYEYRLDTKKNPTSISTAEGVSYRLSYDTKGNPTSSELFSASQMTSSVVEGKEYYIRNMATGKYLDIQGGSSASGTPVVQYVFNGSAAQRFRLESSGDGCYYIIPMVSPTLVLDVSWGNPANNTPIQTYYRNSSASQEFKVTPNDDGSWRITTRLTDDKSELTVPAASQVLSTPVLQIQDGGNADQHWYFEEVHQTRSDVPQAGGIYSIRLSHSGQYLEMASTTGASLKQQP